MGTHSTVFYGAKLIELKQQQQQNHLENSTSSKTTDRIVDVEPVEHKWSICIHENSYKQIEAKVNWATAKCVSNFKRKKELQILSSLFVCLQSAKFARHQITFLSLAYSFAETSTIELSSWKQLFLSALPANSFTQSKVRRSGWLMAVKYIEVEGM